MQIGKEGECLVMQMWAPTPRILAPGRLGTGHGPI